MAETLEERKRRVLASVAAQQVVTPAATVIVKGYATVTDIGDEPEMPITADLLERLRSLSIGLDLRDIWWSAIPDLRIQSKGGAIRFVEPDREGVLLAVSELNVSRVLGDAELEALRQWVLDYWHDDALDFDKPEWAARLTIHLPEGDTREPVTIAQTITTKRG